MQNLRKHLPARGLEGHNAGKRGNILPTMPLLEELCLPFPVWETTVFNTFQVYKSFQQTWVRLRELQTHFPHHLNPLWFYFMSPHHFSVGPFVLSLRLICILYCQANMSKCFCITKYSFSTVPRGKAVLKPSFSGAPGELPWRHAHRQHRRGQQPPGKELQENHHHGVVHAGLPDPLSLQNRAK